MKKLFLMILIAFILPFNALATKDKYIEGIHYEVLKGVKKEKTLWKIYSVYCKYCYLYENAVIGELVEAIPEDIDLKDIFYDGMGQYGKQASYLLAVLYNSDMEKYNKVKKFYYTEAITKKGKDIKNIGEKNFLELGLKEASYTYEMYEKELLTPNVQETIKNWELISKSIARKNGIPAFVVNEIYLVKIKSIKSKKMFIDLVLFLLEK